MLDFLFWWFVFGAIGVALIFYGDLQERLKWDDAEIDLGEVIAYLFMTVFGPVLLWSALKDTFELGTIGDLLADFADRFSEVKIYTFKKHSKGE